MAFEAAQTAAANRKGIPVVFCSQHGEVKRSLEILEPLAREEAISPAAFSLSVHNAISGLYSIASADTAPMTALAGEADGAGHALVEACAQLAAGAPEVLLVVYDEPLPENYRAYAMGPEQAFAWAWLLTAPHGQAYTWSWRAHADTDPMQPAESFGLRMLRCFLTDATQEILPGQRRQWQWGRHA